MDFHGVEIMSKRKLQVCQFGINENMISISES
jgi:hypothetical protein